ncbi:hypothetical protein L596_019256 [Steinernema carpocapsae]|uniref:Uncharacterized protein n=1 Tax=Steinernema carpocapsae TaxID=34508 RepID=A0A4U5MPU8_STECR|nr:hypothetical protein L596_019256 [Steinernema carpocapsae]
MSGASVTSRRSTRSQNSDCQKSDRNTQDLDLNTDANFYPTVLALVVFGLSNVAATRLLGVLPPQFLGILALLAAVFALQFFLLFGHHFCRTIHVFYDEANILATNDAFECYDGTPMDDSTPGGCCGPYPVLGPQDSFYVQHYGNMMPNAKRFEAEWREADRKRLEAKAAQEMKPEKKLSDG